MFSLHCDLPTDEYDKRIIPLLRRMVNLKNLHLFLRIDRKIGLVDGYELKTNIISHMQQLNKCTFHIYSRRFHRASMNLPFHEEIQCISEHISDLFISI